MQATQSKPESKRKSVPAGVNLAKKPQIDLKQIDMNDVDQVMPIMLVMRPPGALNPGAEGASADQDTKMGRRKKRDPKSLFDSEKETNRQISSFKMAWKRLRPDQEKSSEQSDEENQPSVLP